MAKTCVRGVQVMTKAEQLQKDFDDLTNKQATVIKDRDALKQVRLPSQPAPLHHVMHTASCSRNRPAFDAPPCTPKL